MKKLLLSFLFMLLSPLVMAQGQIEFVARVSEVNVDPDNPLVGNLKVSLILNAELRILVDERTEIEDEDGDPISLSEIAVGSFVKVEGIFTSEGILALEIKLAGERREFEIRGVITNVNPNDRTLTVSSIVISVPPEAEIKDSNGIPLLFSDLQPGQVVKVEGHFSEGDFIADEVKVIPADAAIARVKLRGFVTRMDGDLMEVHIETVGPALVRITPDTDIRGELAVGKYVQVVGRLHTDLSVIAHHITVIPLVHLAPWRLKMHPTETRNVEVVLRVPQEIDVTFNLASLDPEIAVPLVPMVTIPAGSVNAAFQVASGDDEGRTEIAVGLPAALGGGEISLRVEVREPSPDGDDPRMKIHWIPRKLNMGRDSRKRAVVQINWTADTNIPVALSQEEGDPGVVDYPSDVVIPEGERRAAVEFVSGPHTGEVEIEAALPEEYGGDRDEIEIEVRGRHGSGRSLKWVPDELEARTNQTVSARLVLSGPADSDLTVTLSAPPPHASMVAFRPEIVIPAGTTEVLVEFQAGDKTGKAQIRASLAFRKGGAHDKLEIEISE